MPLGSAKQNSTLPADDFYAVTPDDNTDLPIPTRAVTLAVGGTLKVHKLSGAVETLTLPAGQHSLRVRRICAAGTTATGITALV